MIQLYFLSILFNGLAGYILFTGAGDKTEHIETSLKFSLRNHTFQFVLGILCAITGILKLLSPTADKETILILGDLVPALAGITAGFMLIFGFYREYDPGENSETEGKLNRLGGALLQYKKAAGIVFITVAVLHFLFPQVLFL